MSAKRMQIREEIQITGASENNLKRVSVNIPKERLVVVAGVSGSGKSSLAFDTEMCIRDRHDPPCPAV